MSVALFSGIGSWWFTNFIFHPWKEVQELRRKSRFAIIYWHHATRETTAAASAAFRKIAFELLSLNDTSPHWFKRLLKFKSYDLPAASNGMIGLSWSGEGDFVHRAIHRHQVEKALMLQLEFSDEDYERIYTRWVSENDSGCDDYDGPGDAVEELFIATG